MTVSETQTVPFDLTKVMSKINYDELWTKETLSVLYLGLTRFVHLGAHLICNRNPYKGNQALKIKLTGS